MSQDENNNQNFDDPLGANSPDFEEQPEYNPPRPRHASAGSWSFMDFLEGTDNNAAEADGIRYRELQSFQTFSISSLDRQKCHHTNSVEKMLSNNMRTKIYVAY